MKPKTLHETFAAYRACKVLLARHLVPHPPELRAVPGYEKAQDPDRIHAPRVYPSGPSDSIYLTASMLTRKEESWQEFVDHVNRRVKRLPQYQRDVIRVRYLGTEPLPSDHDASDRLRVLGWPNNPETFRMERDKALITLSRWLRVGLVWTYFRDSDHS